VRVIAGSLSGRIFESPKSLATHPMSERVRGGLFNTLGDISGLTVFDPFSGSGALSFEAVSRGALRAIALDSDKQAYQTIRTNIDILQAADKVEVFLKQASSWMSGHQDARFDVVIADPPYTDLRRDLLLRVAPNDNRPRYIRVVMAG